MNFQENFVGALTLNQKTMVALRERSDVFCAAFSYSYSPRWSRDCSHRSAARYAKWRPRATESK